MYNKEPSLELIAKLKWQSDSFLPPKNIDAAYASLHFSSYTTNNFIFYLQ